MIPLITGQELAFYILAPLSIALALGMVLSRKPVHSALSLAGMMVCLGALYASLQAPFLFVAQIIVYTGAVMMLFVFTMMIVGVDTVDSVVETLKAQRILTAIAVLGFLVLLVLAIGNGIYLMSSDQLAETQLSNNNAVGLADLIFGRYVVAFEFTSALLVVAAIAAMALTHGEKMKAPERQKARSERKIRQFETEGKHPGAKPGPGAYARHNSIDYPGLLPDGSIAERSISPTLNVRGVAVVQPDGLKAPHLAANKAIAEAWDELDGTDEASKYADSTLESSRPTRVLDTGDDNGKEG